MKPRIDSLRQQIAQLQALHDAGTLGAGAHAEARQRLERALVDAVLADAAPAAAGASRALWAGLLLAVLVLALAGYGLTGSPGRAGLGPDPARASLGPAMAAASNDAATAPDGAAASTGAPDGAADVPRAQVDDVQVTEVVERMAQRLKERPDDGAGWALLARAWSALGRHTEAVPAFRKAIALTGDDAGLLADLADTLAAQHNGKFDAEAIGLIERALARDPQNLKAQALSGSVAFDRRDYAAAVRHWQQAERGLPNDSRILPQLRASIAQARDLGGLPLETVAAASPSGTPGGAPGGGVSGTVSLAPALAQRVQPGDTLFVLARAAEGPRMPLAVLRLQAKDLPLRFTLDDSMAMDASAKLSDHAQVVVSARISKAGDAMPQPGDLSGQSGPVVPGTSGIELRISEVVAQ